MSGHKSNNIVSQRICEFKIYVYVKTYTGISVLLSRDTLNLIHAIPTLIAMVAPCRYSRTWAV